MKNTLLYFFLILYTYTCYAVKLNDLIVMEKDTVSFITKFDSTSATKDGYYLDKYVVNIPDALVKNIHGKKIKISGEVIIHEGLNSIPKTYDTNGNEIIQQGRSSDTFYILNPIIEIIDSE